MRPFDEKSNAEKMSTVKNVVSVMLADGKITHEEQEYLKTMSVRIGLSKSQLEYILKNIESIEFTPAKTKEERFDQLLNAVIMMMVDGDIDKSELTLCHDLAAKLMFSEDTVEDIVQRCIAVAKGKIKDGLL